MECIDHCLLIIGSHPMIICPHLNIEPHYPWSLSKRWASDCIDHQQQGGLFTIQHHLTTFQVGLSWFMNHLNHSSWQLMIIHPIQWSNVASDLRSRSQHLRRSVVLQSYEHLGFVAGTTDVWESEAGKSMGKPWKMVEKQWKIAEHPWKIHGKWWKNQ